MCLETRLIFPRDCFVNTEHAHSDSLCDAELLKMS